LIILKINKLVIYVKGNLIRLPFFVLYKSIFVYQMKNVVILLLAFLSVICNAQSKDSSNSTNNKYLEDQLYLGVTYNSLYDLPIGIDQNGFSNGIFLGYMKDIPINAQRNIGFGIGLGYGRNTYFQDLKIAKENGVTIFEEVKAFDRNKFSLHAIELPIEIRWRTSTPTKYKFWRIYSGMKLAYIFASNAKLKKQGTIKVNGIDEINKFQYGLTLGAGYGTWNLNVYYGLNNIFSSDVILNNSTIPVKGRDLRIGLIFYIL